MFTGPSPMVEACKDADHECLIVGKWIKDRLQEGRAASEVGVFVRSDAELKRARNAVKAAGARVVELNDKVEVEDGAVAISTMHFAKGLEFRSVVVMACDDDVIPQSDRIEMVAKKTEYLVTQYASDSSILKELRAPKSINLRLLLERLICQDLGDDAVISSCLRSNSKRFYDPFKIIDMREQHRCDQASDALNADPETRDPIGVYNSAWHAQIPLGKTLMIAGVNRDYFVKEVEV